VDKQVHNIFASGDRVKHMKMRFAGSEEAGGFDPPPPIVHTR